jgi:hypothetical protein
MPKLIEKSPSTLTLQFLTTLIKMDHRPKYETLQFLQESKGEKNALALGTGTTLKEVSVANDEIT